MKISSKSWKSYVDRLSKIDQIAAGKVSEWYRNHPDADIEELINITYYYCEHYGDAAGALACEMYDEMAMTSGRTIPPAEPAKTATYGEVASALQGALLRTQDPDVIGSIAGRKVKTVGLDTLLNNSLRDGAEFAWIPSGDTCAFCIMLASNGWQKASKRAFKNGHAEHVHSNCDCTYAIRFDENTEVEGYDPDYYRSIYDNAEGDSWRDKVNSIRRANYANNKDAINAQKRAAYSERKARFSLQTESSRSIMNIDTGGRRNEEPLTDAQISECKAYAQSLGMPATNIAYSINYWTSYNPELDILLLGTDAYPGKSPSSANGRLSYKCAIAHEIVGHRESCIRGKTRFLKGDVRDEAQASIRAARFAPDLTRAERLSLIRDALERLHSKGLSIRDVRDLLDIYER